MILIIPTTTAIGAARRQQERPAARGCARSNRLVVLAALAALSSAFHLAPSPASAANFAAVNSNVAASAEGNVFVNGMREQDEILLVSVRQVGSCCDPTIMAERTRIESYQAGDENGCRQWLPADMDSLAAADPRVATVIFVHGNRITPWDAKREGVAAYRCIVRQSDSALPIRFVIFSWPSSQIRGPLKDVRVKATRTRPAGCQLAWVIDQLPAETPVTLVGFSYGARIITGALHNHGGGSLGGMSGGELQHPGRAPMNAVLLAAALNADWLCPGHYHGQAMTQVDRMLLVNNHEDPAMRYYHLSSTSGHPQALGLCGPTCIDSAGAAKIMRRDVARCVGSNHDLFRYLSAPGVAGQIWEFASGTSVSL